MSETNPGMAVKPRRRPRRLWLAAGHMLLATAVFAGLALLALTLSGSSIPVPGRLAELVESRVNAGLDSGRVVLGQASLDLNPGQRPQLLLEGVGIFGGDDAEILRLDAVRTRLAPRQLLQGVVAPDEILISGAHVTIRRNQDGEFALSFGTDGGAGGSLASSLGNLDHALEAGPLAQLSSIVADGLNITVDDRRANRTWRATDGALAMQRTGTGLDLTVAADFLGDAGAPISTTVGLRTESGSPYTAVTASVHSASASDIAAQSPALHFLNAVDAPVSGTVAAWLGSQGEITGVTGSLSIGLGELRTVPDDPPIGIERAQVEVAYDPATNAFDFSRAEIQSDFLTAAGGGTALLQEFSDRMPGAVVGHLALSDISLAQNSLYAEPLGFEAGSVDFRIRFSPLRVDVGQLTLRDAGWRLTGKGNAAVSAAGWDAELDVGLDSLPLDRLVALWPTSVAPEIREWLGTSVTAGEISDLAGAIRVSAGERPTFALSSNFSGIDLSAPDPVPPVRGIGGYMSLLDGSYILAIEKGAVVPPMGGGISIAGSVLGIEDIFADERRLEATVLSDSTMTSVLSLLDLPPLELLKDSVLKADLADGRARLRTEIALDRIGADAPATPSFEVTGQLLDVVSDTLVRNRRLQAEVLNMHADSDGIEISGPGYLGQVPVTAAWSQGFGPGSRGKSRVSGTAELSQRFLDEFGIRLPPGSVSGSGVARITVSMTGDGSPSFDLDSDLTGVGLRLRGLGWSKSEDRAGTLGVKGRLGEQAEVESLVIEAPGLSASGTVEFGPGLRLDRARFSRVSVGGWLDGPVTLTGRGAGLAPAVAVTGGSVDIRSMQVTPGGEGRGGPLKLALDRLVVTERIALTKFVGEFVTDGGLNGRFTASVNGGPPVRGTLLPGNPGAAIRIESDRAGAVLAELGVFRNARGGSIEVSLTPAGERGTYEGRMSAENVKVVDAPVMAELLSAISIVGLLDQMTSGGITMSKIDSEFRLGPGYLLLHPSSAVGPSLGISLEGVLDSKNRRLDMQGVISPVYFLNAIGRLFTRDGEGLFGFTFELAGDTGDPRVSVNPVSILTPGMFREIFRKPPPTRP